MWELDHKEGWAQKNWCFWTVVLEKTLESPLDSKEIKPVNPKGNPPRIFIGRTDAEAEAPILWPPNAKSWFIRKDPDAEKDWRQEEKGMTEDKMGGWHHHLNGHDFEQFWEMVKDREAWRAVVHGVAKSQTWLSITVIKRLSIPAFGENAGNWNAYFVDEKGCIWKMHLLWKNTPVLSLKGKHKFTVWSKWLYS